MASYPTSIKTFTPVQDRVDIVEANDVDDLQDEVRALEVALGIQPAQSTMFPTVGSVSERLDAIESAIATLQGYFSGSGTIPMSSVTGLSAALSSESSARAAADTTLQTSLTSLSSNLDFYKKTQLRAMVAVVRTTNQSIPSGVWTDLVPNSRAKYVNPYLPYAVPGDHDFEENGKFYTSTTGSGTYFLSARFTFLSDPTGIRGVRLITSTGEIVEQKFIDASITGSDACYLDTFLLVSSAYRHRTDPGYYFKFQAYQNRGSALNIYADSNTIPFDLECSFVPD